MSNKIYNSMKLGHKINIGQDIADRVRSFVFNNSWDEFDSEAVKGILSRVMRNYFIATNMEENEYTQADISELEQLITEKVLASYDKFASQDATAKQVYYYMALCNEVGEECQQITVNKHIHNEINRLVELKEERGAVSR